MQHTEDRESIMILISGACDSDARRADIEIAELVQLLGLPDSVRPAAQALPLEQKENQGENPPLAAETLAKE